MTDTVIRPQLSLEAIETRISEAIKAADTAFYKYDKLQNKKSRRRRGRHLEEVAVARDDCFKKRHEEKCVISDATSQGIHYGFNPHLNCHTAVWSLHLDACLTELGLFEDTCEQLRHGGLESVRDVRDMSATRLRNDFGLNTGELNNVYERLAYNHIRWGKRFA